MVSFYLLLPFIFLGFLSVTFIGPSSCKIIAPGPNLEESHSKVRGVVKLRVVSSGSEAIDLNCEGLPSKVAH